MVNIALGSATRLPFSDAARAVVVVHGGMYPNDHLPPHFHAVYGEFEALIEIDT
jgi:hypothetical protein